MFKSNSVFTARLPTVTSYLPFSLLVRVPAPTVRHNTRPVPSRI